MGDKPISAIVLAAGKGTRMKSAHPKVLHQLLGKPLLQHVIDSIRSSGISDMAVVIGHGAQQVRDYLNGIGCRWIQQEEQLGTGHAVMCCLPYFKDFPGHVLIICGDTPLFLPETLRSFLDAHFESGSRLSILTTEMADPTGYGRIVRGPDGRLLGIVEEKDASPDQRSIKEVNTGTYLVKVSDLFRLLQSVKPNNSQSEYYLTDIVALGVKEGLEPMAFSLAHPEEALGVNSREQLAQAETILLNRVRSDLMDSGVTLHMPDTCYIEPTVTVGQDAVIGPFCVLKGSTSVGAGAKLMGMCYLSDAVVPSGSVVGPFYVDLGAKGQGK